MNLEIDRSEQNIIHRLTTLLEVIYVYKLPIKVRGKDQLVFIVLLKGNCSSLTRELSAMVAKIFQEETDFLYRMFSLEYAEQQLKIGNLFFIHGCSWDKVIFHDAEEGADAFHKFCGTGNILTRIESNFQKELSKLNAFMEGATFFIEREDLPQATFMLHQYIELWFRTVELIMMGKERKSHSIKEHQTYINAFVPDLGDLFNTDDPGEQALLRLLDEAYITTRYQNNYYINKEQILKIQEKAKLMYTQVSGLFKAKLAACRKDFGTQEFVPETNLTREDPSQKEIPQSNENKILGKIKKLAERHFHTLKSNPHRKEAYSTNLLTDGYLETSFRMANLLKACIIALEADYAPNRILQHPEHNIREVLGYILCMMPYEEMELLDKIRSLLSEKEINVSP